MERLLPRVVAAFESFRATTYPDPVGLPTIGFGHLIRHGETFEEPMSKEAALLLLEKDLATARQAVDHLFRGVFLADHEWEALTSWVFNVGEGNASTSTLRHKVAVGDMHAAGHEFLKWVYATKRDPDGVVRKVKLPGLVRRRDVESCWFLGAHPSTVARMAGVPDDSD